jgi:hypothetical protein
MEYTFTVAGCQLLRNRKFILMFSKKAIKYFRNIEPPAILPAGVEILNPYKDRMYLVEEFYNHFFNDDKPRVFIFGINPGRFGGGLTGISFTDPVALRNFCGIENDLGNKRELSSEFIYMMIERFGGTEEFFRSCYLTALFPFALLKNKKNYNFYDDKETFKRLLPSLKESVEKQSSFGAGKDKVISLGLKNAGILSLINDELKLFKRIEVLEHPRFIMQYKRKSVDDFIRKYIKAIK